jgi:quaternary ammonium compound-resistance protein SugE
METRTAWILLLVAGLLEVVWAVALKQTAGFSRLLPSAIGIAAAAASFFLLALALKSLPVGPAYATWVAMGVTGTAIVGAVALDEPLSAGHALCLGLIVAGVAGLRLLDS